MTATLAPPRARSETIPLDVELARRLLRDVAKKKLGMFANFPDLSVEDLAAEALAEVVQAWPTYTRARGSPSTFIVTVGVRHLLNLLRGRVRDNDRRLVVVDQVRQRRGQFLRAVAEWTAVGDDAGLPGGAGDRGDETLEDRVGAVYRFAVHAFPTPRRRGRRGHGLPSLVAAAYLMHHRSLSTRGAEMLIDENADLREAMGLKETPSHMWFSRAGNYVTDFQRARAKAAALN